MNKNKQAATIIFILNYFLKIKFNTRYAIINIII